MKTNLFVLFMDEDGDFHSHEIEDFDKWMKDITDGWGLDRQPVFLSEMPKDWNYAKGYLLIRGNIIVPEPVSVVTQYVLP